MAIVDEMWMEQIRKQTDRLLQKERATCPHSTQIITTDGYIICEKCLLIMEVVDGNSR